MLILVDDYLMNGMKNDVLMMMIIDVDMIIDWKEKNRVFRSIWNECRMNNVIEIDLNWWDGVMWYEILLSF